MVLFKSSKVKKKKDSEIEHEWVDELLKPVPSGIIPVTMSPGTGRQFYVTSSTPNPLEKLEERLAFLEEKVSTYEEAIAFLIEELRR